MKPFMTTKNPKLLDPIRKYWYLCFLYIIFSYLLIRIIVIGSSKIADATDSLFAGEKAALLEFMIPFIILMLLGGAIAFGKSYSKNTFSICMQTDIRNMLVSKLVEIRIPYFDTEGTGTLMNKLLSDMYQTEALFAEGIGAFRSDNYYNNCVQLHRITKCTSVVGDNDLLSVAVLECRETDQNGWENSRSAQAVV
jgi:ABC-type multidrug transport system fused ATPase/permease subunit